MFFITPWREQHSISFQLCFYGSSVFCSWKCSTGETSVLLVWAWQSRKQWSSAMKKKQPVMPQLVRHGLAVEVMLELRPEWRLPLYHYLLSEHFRQSQGPGWEQAWCVLETERGLEGSRGRWCQRGGNGSHNTSQARSLDVIPRARKSHWRALGREKRQKLVCLFKGPPWLLSEEEPMGRRARVRRPIRRLGLGCQLGRQREETNRSGAGRTWYLAGCRRWGEGKNGGQKSKEKTHVSREDQMTF